MKFCLVVLAVVFSFNFKSAEAGGGTTWCVPTEIEKVANGILVKGDFSDVNSCGQAGYIFYPDSHLRPDAFLSIMLTALTAKKEVKLYTDSCVAVSFHWAGNVINRVLDNGAYLIRS